MKRKTESKGGAPSRPGRRFAEGKTCCQHRWLGPVAKSGPVMW